MPLTEKQARQTMAKIAEEKGITIFEVRAEMEKAISVGFASKEPHAVAFWRSVPKKGAKPTPEEFLSYMAEIGV